MSFPQSWGSSSWELELRAATLGQALRRQQAIDLRAIRRAGDRPVLHLVSQRS